MNNASPTNWSRKFTKKDFYNNLILVSNQRLKRNMTGGCKVFAREIPDKVIDDV